MTPQEKAKELLDKYRTYVVMWAGGTDVENTNVKQCALIAVEEMMHSYDKNKELVSELIMVYNFWKEVKEQIEKL